MKMRAILSWCVLSLVNILYAQDSVVLVLPAMYDGSRQEIFLGSLNGWRFKAGHDTAWAKIDLDDSDWGELKPIQLSARLVNEEGYLEGWFRIKIRLDSSFQDQELDIISNTWAKADLFIDEERIASFADKSWVEKGKEQVRYVIEPPVPVHLRTGHVYTIALHVKDQSSPFYFRKLKSELGGLRSLVKLTGPKHLLNSIVFVQEISVYTTIWNTVCVVLSLLFWFLYSQNPLEKNLLLIALASTFFSMEILCYSYASASAELLYNGIAIMSYGKDVFLILFKLTVPLTLSNIFKNNIEKRLRRFLIFYGLALFGNIFFDVRYLDILLESILIVLCLYYILSSWKNVRGAQWSIVAGLLISLGWLLLLTIGFARYHSPFFPFFYLYVTGIYVSLPLSLLVYVAVRFKEIILAVTENANEVMRLSVEKRLHATRQRQILEDEVARQTNELRVSYENLKATQGQLIQAEKMASLGELTAGIAHEIQNPLNFVNNFSEVSNELIDEMKSELATGNWQLATEISQDLKQNLEKINHHGKRAGDIVKGMLQHSRSSSGVKEPTDINALADEYLRLAYHGLRAKDKSFNATTKTEFDPSIGNVNVVPQDIGRVILNLITNAFYAVSERSKSGISGYEPTVVVSTKKSGGEVEIRVKDNGNGIPQKVLDKIFQPFFTTKPTGQGTGLGLSLSYDIVKAHGGALKVETMVARPVDPVGRGEGSTFILQLPNS